MVFWTSVGQCTVGDLVRWVDSELMRPSLLSNTSLRSISGGAMTRSQGRGVVLRMQIFFFLIVLFWYTSTSRTCALFSHTRTNYLAVEWTNDKAEVCITCVLPLQDYLALSDFGPGSHFGCCFPRVAFKDEKVTDWSKVTPRYCSLCLGLTPSNKTLALD